MPSPRRTERLWATVIVAVSLAAVLSGCARSQYRLQADHDAYTVIAERNGDPRWSSEFGIELDPRSRYFDPHDPDHPPMPPDDPAAHSYMHHVDGMDGWAHWEDNGVRVELENPAWREALASYAPKTTEGEVELDIETALKLAYLHSPLHQSQLETLYLTALDVTAERFRLSSQFFGGYDLDYQHGGSLLPASLVFDPVARRYVVAPPADIDSLENNTLTVGRPSAGDPALLLSRRFATAGELLVGFANSFVFEFTGGDANLASSLANVSLIQPLLRGAGRDVALEELTRDERNLLGSLRAYSQFRQGFYTQVAIGELGVSGPRRFGAGTNLQSFSGSGFTGGYVGLLQQLRQIRNARENLQLQMRTLNRLVSLENSQLIDTVQVDQFKQSVYAQEAELLSRENAYALALDRYKVDTLGLPPNLALALDQSLIDQFQLLPAEASRVQTAMLDVQRRLSELPESPEVATLDRILTELESFIEPVERLFQVTGDELRRMEEIVPAREASMTPQEVDEYRDDRERLYARFADLRSGKVGFEGAVVKLKAIPSGLSEESREATLRGATAWVAQFIQVVERLSLVPAQARLEVIVVEGVEMDPEDAFRIALSNRLDFMNGRAALVDQWRQIQVTGDSLQSVLNITAGGDIRTARNNPLSFRAPTGSMRLGLEFDAPFTRLLERNAYRESLIEYQRSRRAYIQSRDNLHLGLRALLRNLEQLRKNLEIQRRAVTIALRRVDQTQLLLNPAQPLQQPGGRPSINPTTAINLLGAQGALQSTQNAFLAAWLSYYAERMRLYRELGVMALDQDGRWVELPLTSDELPELPGPPLEPLPGPPLEPLPGPPLEPLPAPLPDSVDTEPPSPPAPTP